MKTAFRCFLYRSVNVKPRNVELTASGETLNEEYSQMLDQAEAYARNFTRTGSAFAGYLQAQLILERTSRGVGSRLRSPVERAFKGFAFAAKRGDHQARNRALELAQAVGADLSVYYRFGAYHRFLENSAGIGCGSYGWDRAEIMPSNKTQP